MKLNYRIEITKLISDQGSEWFVSYPGLGVAGGGKFLLVALWRLRRDAKYYIRTLREEGLEVPAEDIYEWPPLFEGKHPHLKITKESNYILVSHEQKNVFGYGHTLEDAIDMLLDDVVERVLDEVQYGD